MTRTGAALTALMLFGCVGQAPAIVHYDLQGAARVKGSRAPASAPSIEVERLNAAAPYDNDQIALRTGTLRLDYFRYHRWIAPMPDMVTELLATTWRDTERFSRVEVDNGASDVDLIVTGRIRAFEVDLTRPETPTARVVIAITGRSPTGAIKYEREMQRHVRAADSSIDSLVVALRRAANEIARAAAPELADAARAL